MSTFNQTNDYMSYQNNQAYQQNDFIDQATKVLDFVDRIGQRNQPQISPLDAPSNAPSQYSVGNFQSRTAQDFARQESRFSQNYSESYYQSLASKSLNINIKLLDALDALDSENQAIYKYADSLFPFLQTNAVLNAEIEALEHTLAMVVPFMAIADARTKELLETEYTLDLVCDTLSDPDFLIYYAFKQWRKSIQADGQNALEWIADEWLNLISIYNKKYRNKYGRPSPLETNNTNNNYTMQSASYQQQLPSNVPAPPIPSFNNSGGSPIDALKNKIEAMKNGGYDLAANLQRQHTMNRQQSNQFVDMYL